jgi:hypothetical protein
MESQEYTKEQFEREAAFLLGWAKGKQITRFNPESNFYSKGKLMTQISQGMIALMLQAGLATGTQDSFKMVKPAKSSK